ncbi:adenosylcobinamide-GDP ribazoletransferase [Clostridium rectalis]|uniref:adenosylcobinamide-GDP ribazoletransferase n=1 Tax=Clostridium rectalis TaxID=2040295 RepID=UPI000F63658F|nr:adenosylcobinamide-GDP ribazoletransferase [Clostridium rectalis]
MKKYLYDFLLMIQFLTRIPVKKSLPCEMKNFRDGTAMFPLIGLLIGAIEWGVYYVSIKFFPSNITAIFVILVGILLMGCLHQDGFGDIFDGFFSFKGDSDKIIEIMKDSRIGTFACVALIFDILIKYATLSIAIHKNVSAIIIVTPIISKCTVSFMALVGKRAKKNGTGNLFIGNTTIAHFLISLLITIGICSYLLGVTTALMSIIVGIIITLIVLKLCNNKIGGVTGDCLGANNEFVELGVLLFFSALLSR